MLAWWVTGLLFTAVRVLPVDGFSVLTLYKIWHLCGLDLWPSTVQVLGTWHFVRTTFHQVWRRHTTFIQQLWHIVFLSFVRPDDLEFSPYNVEMVSRVTNVTEDMHRPILTSSDFPFLIYNSQTDKLIWDITVHCCVAVRQ